MKSGNRSEFPTKLDELKKIARFPRRIPIEFEGNKCGTLIIDYESSRFPEKLADGAEFYQQLAQVNTFMEIIALSGFWKRDIELSLLLRTIYTAKTHRLLKIFLSYDYGGDVRERFKGRDSYALGDDLVLEFIDSAGPSALRVMAVMAVLLRWLSDPKRAKLRLEKLSAALIHHQTGKRIEDIRFPDGRPASDSIEYLGTTIIREFYEDLAALIKIAKRIKGPRHFSDHEKGIAELNRLIQDAMTCYLSTLESQVKKDENGRMAKCRLERLRGLVDEKSANCPYSFVVDCLKSDPDLLAGFNIKQSKPNMLAKEIIGKLLGVSSNTIDNVLYPRHPKNPKKND